MLEPENSQDGKNLIPEFEDLMDLLDLVPANRSLAVPPNVDRMDPNMIQQLGAPKGGMSLACCSP